MSSLPPDLEPSRELPKDPRDAAHRRYWKYYNRPYPGCGLVWTVLLLILICWLLSLLFPRTAY
jgi:hypothetical protein